MLGRNISVSQNVYIAPPLFFLVGLALVGLSHVRLQVLMLSSRVGVGVTRVGTRVKVVGRSVWDGRHGGRRGSADEMHGDVEETDGHDEASDQDVKPLPGEG